MRPPRGAGVVSAQRCWVACLQATAFAILLFAAAIALQSDLEAAMSTYMTYTFGPAKMRKVAEMKGIVATLATPHPRWG